ncbi:MAG: SecDF P1 head subdomain-containing protein, partial [Bellilinea sp.]
RGWPVSIQLTESGAIRFETFTQANVGSVIRIVIGDREFSRAGIVAPIDSGRLQGTFSSQAAAIAWQRMLAGELPVCTVGSASNRLDLATWGAYLLTLERLYAVYDPDAAGESGRRWLEGLSERTRPLWLPPGFRDVNDLILQGGDLAGWLRAQLTERRR